MTILTDKQIFQAIKDRKGSGLTQAEVDTINAIMYPRKSDAWILLAAELVERFEGLAKLLPGGKVEAYPDPGPAGAP